MIITVPTFTLCIKFYISSCLFIQDDMTGDGTTSNVLIIGELLKQADLYISEGLHPSIVTEGFDMALQQALKVRMLCNHILAIFLYIHGSFLCYQIIGHTHTTHTYTTHNTHTYNATVHYVIKCN